MSDLRPVILEERTDNCPYCGKKALLIVEAIHHVPHFGRLMMTTLKCRNCGYKHTSVMHIEQRTPIRFIVRVEQPEDLNIKIVRSPTATVRIPELGIIIEPGPLAQGEITTIEGYLRRVQDLLDSLFEPEEVANVKRTIERAIEGKLSFTFILEDPFGNSGVLHEATDKVKMEEIPEHELKNIKYGEAVLEMRGVRSGKTKKAD